MFRACQMWLVGMPRYSTSSVVAGIAVAVVIACATLAPRSSPTPPPPPPAVENTPAIRPGWPESWSIEFGLGCTGTGEDVLTCACVAREVQLEWTPEQFRSLGPEGLRDMVRVCRERMGAVP